MRQPRFMVCVVALAAQFAAASSLFAADGASLDAELGELTRAMTRLANAVESQMHGRNDDRDLQRLRVAVSILDIRARQYEALQSRLRTLEDREGNAVRYIEVTESKIADVKDQLIDAADDPKRAELQKELANLEINLNSSRLRLEQARQMQLDVQAQLMNQERLVQDVEERVEGWLAGLEIDDRSSD